MSSPNEPGYPRSADRPGSANGSPPANGEETGQAANRSSSVSSGPETAEVPPPWQWGTAARSASPAQGQAGRPARESRQDSTRNSGSTGHSPGVDARLNRFVSGGAPAAPTGSSKEEPVAPVRPENTHNEAYASELPDLSGPVPRPPRKATPEQRPAERKTPETPSRPAQATSRIQVGNRSTGPVRASMQIRRLDPWSVLKVSLVLSVALFFVWMISVAFLYLVLGGMGVWSKLNSNVGDLLTSASGSGGELVSSGTIFGGAALIGLVNIVVLTAMATVGAFIYNLTTDLVGGIEVTLADRD